MLRMGIVRGERQVRNDKDLVVLEAPMQTTRFALMGLLVLLLSGCAHLGQQQGNEEVAERFNQAPRLPPLI
ncbi:hypothetical protein CAI21_19965 [Alkalilimnicola ehrlichii]|uniref:Lipoprotein n=1 Tax=Alkalilimnicola ehrlichii TaxID=351052 RepID=A0A3E0WGV4_9GAMM|nr:hypothetical protein CAI21_19965 [Alkalilimnicola ehrlichii]RFA32124.1 hypothetical protein CAL65_20550 [Alkalilimnicola ehrlichii]